MASGKTTTANFLKDHLGFKLLSLATPIKQMEQELADGVEPYVIAGKYMREVYDPMQLAMFTQVLKEARELPRESPKPRKRLQFIGTEGARNRISDSTWIDFAIMEANKSENVVIDDVRFVNEFHAFRKAGWKSILLSILPSVQRSRIEKLYHGFDESVYKHASETGVDDIRRLGEHDFNLDTSFLTDEENHKIMERLMKLWSSE